MKLVINRLYGNRWEKSLAVISQTALFIKKISIFKSGLVIEK